MALRKRMRAARPTKYGKRHVPGQMNKTETAYAEDLAVREIAGFVTRWAFEAVTLRLGPNRLSYTPDFFVQLADGTVELIDVKGGGPIDDKSIVKIKVAADQFPEFAFAMAIQRPKKLGGGWNMKEF